VKWDESETLDCTGTVCRRMAASYDHGNGLSSFINNGGYSLCNGEMDQLFIDFKKANVSVGNWVLHNILIEFNVHIKQIK
jgi:hypothetical protein